MARIARVIAAGIPHHVTQRGNRRMQTFFQDEDYCTEFRGHFVPDAASWPWSSARAHLGLADDPLVKVDPLLEMAGDWRLFLAGMGGEAQLNEIRKHERTGRPLGTESFIERLESALDRPLKLGKPGPKGKVS